MSKEHVNAYYQEVCQNYIEMNEAIKDMEDECNRGLVDPDKLEEMKKMIEPLKNNYMTLSYIMFLFNKPKRKKKEKKYIEKNKIVEKDQDASSVNCENASSQLVNDEYTVTLIADFENESYSLSIREN